MGLDPISIGIGVASGIVGNIVTDIIKLYAPHLDHTFVGRGFKAIGLSESTRDDHLREVLKESLTLYFKTHPTYDISSVADFFKDSVTEQLIANFIFDHRPIDQQALDEALTRHLRNDPIIWMYLQQRGVAPEQIVPDFLACYRQVLNEHTDVEERAILLALYNTTDTVVAKIGDSEERMKVPEQIIGRYRILRYLTTGSFGSLYLAEMQGTGTPAVLKVISVPEGLRLHYDIFSLGDRLVNLHHSSILSTIEVHLDDMIPYIVSAYAEGGSLQNRIRRYAPHGLPLQEAINIITQIGHALSYLHQQSIIHRGVQPASILFDNTDMALLTGFDLAIAVNSIRHFVSPNQVGAIHYMAPEQYTGVLSEKSDQYALGCIAYELCTGCQLNLMIAQPTSQQRLSSPLAPRRLNPTLSIQIERAILKAIAVNPDHRYSTVEAFVTSLGTQ